MPGETTTSEQIRLEDAAYQYLGALKPTVRTEAQPEVLKFARWLGAERELNTMRGHEVAQYAENLPPSVSDASRRADVVRAFLKWAKERGYTNENLGTHLRIRKATKSSGLAQTLEEQPVHLTKEGHDALVAEMEELKARRPQIQADLARAMADKDFRENAPLDAARNEQAHVESRIRELESTLRKSVVLEAGHGDGGIAQLGDVVTIRDLRTGADKSYTLVNPNEVSTGQGRISIASPVGRAVYLRRVGEEIEVEAPSGTFRVRLEAIKAS
jgi:transcription elongation factor GreA